MKNKKTKFNLGLIIFLILLVVPTITYAIPYKWGCQISGPPYGDIKIIYKNDNTPHKAEIFAINPQKHPILFSNNKVLLQLNSYSCFKYTIKVKDSSGTEISQYSVEPYSPSNCDNISSDDTGSKFLTLLEFNLPSNSGKYTLDIYDNKNVLLTTGEIEVLNPSISVSSVSRTSSCTIDSSKYFVTLDVPYPLSYQKNKPGKVNVIIDGPSISTINEMFDKMSMSVEPYMGAKVSLNKEGTPICSTSSCNQYYSLTSSGSTSAIARVQYERDATGGKAGVVDEGITILDIDKLKEIKSKLDKTSNVASSYVKYYNSIKDPAKAQVWQDVYNKINPIQKNINNLISAFTSNPKISDIVDLINVVENSQKEIDKITGSLSGVKNE